MTETNQGLQDRFAESIWKVAGAVKEWVPSLFYSLSLHWGSLASIYRLIANVWPGSILQTIFSLPWFFPVRDYYGFFMVNFKRAYVGEFTECRDKKNYTNLLSQPQPFNWIVNLSTNKQNKKKRTDLCRFARTHTPWGQGPMGVCTKIGHLSHMMSRGRGYIIDEPKQHVSVSTHRTARDMGGNSRRWAERGGNSSGRDTALPKCRKKTLQSAVAKDHLA